MTSPLVGIGLVVAVAVAAMLLRRARGTDDATVTPPPEPADLAPGPAETGMPEPDEEDAEEDDTGAEHLALTSDGHAFTPHGRVVLVAPRRHFAAPPPGEEGGHVLPPPGEADMQPPIQLSPGDLIAARVVRGAPDLAPWRLETLGRDRDLVVWPFETEDAALAACDMLERRIVRPPLDRDGDPVPIGDADFDAAEAELERALHALENPTAEDEIPGPPGGDARP